jgi:hypothetical protein
MTLTHHSTRSHKVLVRLALLLALGILALIGMRLNAADASNGVTLNVGNVGPRDLSQEDQTQKAITRDYAKAWQNLNKALADNNPALLGDMWVGIAKDKFVDQINSQKSAGLTTKYVDRGHKLEALFYSSEGSALQLKDTAQVETQTLEGSKVVGTDSSTVHYLVVMTPTADHWQVRILQPVQ